MSAFIKDFIAKETIYRRNFLFASAAGLTSMAMPMAFGTPVNAALKDPVLAWSYRDRANPYWLSIMSGGEAFAESIGRKKEDLVNLINQGASEKSLSDIKAFPDKNAGNCAIANDSPNARPVVEAVKAAGSYISTIRNKTDDLHPCDIGDNYVSHLT